MNYITSNTCYPTATLWRDLTMLFTTSGNLRKSELNFKLLNPVTIKLYGTVVPNSSLTIDVFNSRLRNAGHYCNISKRLFSFSLYSISHIETKLAKRGDHKS